MGAALSPIVPAAPEAQLRCRLLAGQQPHQTHTARPLSGTHLVTGGLGSLGQLMTQWLAAQADLGSEQPGSQSAGAASPLHAVLSSRSAHLAAAQQLLGSVAHSRHVSVCIYQSDVASSEDASALLAASAQVC